MPRESLAPLPAEVRFRNWDRYQDKRTSQWCRLWHNALYDQRIGTTDLARSMFLSGIILAGIGHGSVNVRAWIGQHSDKKRARLKLKSWLDNGLLIGSDAQIDREIDRSTTSAAEAAGEPKPVEPKPVKPKPVARAPKPAATAGRVVPLKRPSWLEPYRQAWEATNGAGSFAAVAGQCARYVKPLHDAHGPDAAAAALARYLAGTAAQYHSVAHFAGTYARWTTAGARADPLDRVRAVMGRYGGPQFTPTEAWDEFDPAAREAIKQAGGLRAIWESHRANGRAHA